MDWIRIYYSISFIYLIGFGDSKMDICKMTCIAALLISFLATAGVVGEDGAITHFDAQYAMERANDDPINNIILKTNANMDAISDSENGDYNLKKKEIISHLNLIVDTTTQIDMGTTIKYPFGSEDGYVIAPMAASINSNAEGQTDYPPTSILNDLKFGSALDSELLKDGSQGFSASEGLAEINSGINADLLLFKNDVDSKLSQIGFIDPMGKSSSISLAYSEPSSSWVDTFEQTATF